MRINHNLMAMNTHRQLGLNANAGAKSIEKLSSGYRINRAGDDAAGLAISEKMRAQVRGLNQASRNAQDGISLVQTAEGALQESQAILQRMRELSVQAANGTNTDEDRATIQDEIAQLKDEVDRIGNATEFNTRKLLNGELQSAGSVVGANGTIGSVVAKQTAATATGSSSIDAMISGVITSADFVKETVAIDGVDIDIHWENLTTDQQNTILNAGTDATTRNAAAELIVNTINEAIDNSGQNIEHVKGWIDGSGKLVIESGSKGTTSKIETASGTAILDQLISASAATSTGTSNYDGTAISTNAEADMYIGDLHLTVSMDAAVANGDTMASVATTVQSSINTAISAYNTMNGFTSGEEGYIESVAVAATDDGRLSITSESGEISFSDLPGSTMVADLGLSEAQVSSAGNGGMTFQIGANKGQTIQFGISDMRSAALGITAANVSTVSQAENTITIVDKALKSISDERSKLGAVQNRLEHTIKNLDTSSENLQASESRIRDVDMAKEMMEFTKNNILQQAAQSMLAQANQAPQGVLQLLR